MLPLGASRPQKPRLLPNVMEKGLVVLQGVASRGSHAAEWKLSPKQASPGKMTQALGGRYRRKSELSQDAIPEDRSFVSEMEELWRVFLRRPGCPEFCTRATSTSMSTPNCGSAVTWPEEEASVVPGAWKRAAHSLSSQQAPRVEADGPLLPLSKSACEFSFLRKKSELQMLSPATDSPVLGQSYLRTRIPWYISVIHEKDHCLSTLWEEIQRLSKLEEQVQRKDEEILALQEEREALKSQLKYLRKSKRQETSECQDVKELPSESAQKPPGRPSTPKPSLEEEGLQRCRQEEYAMVDRARDLEVFSEEEDLEGEAKRAADEGRKEDVREAGGQEEVEEVELELDEEEEAKRAEEGRRRRACSQDESFEEELMAQLEEYARVMQEFQFELEVARTRYSLATGACISLQRQVDYQDSQLQKMKMENELLRKELRERKCQLQAMTDKFSSLREEKKQDELMGLIEKDNVLLQQRVWELEQEVVRREQRVSKARAAASQLQERVIQSEVQLKKQTQVQQETQSRMEVAQHAEQQARVALESSQARLERLRNKIIQAAFSVSGVKSSVTEISDSDILEALQRVISERTDYYNQLKQKGVKVPPLQQSEVASSPSRTKKMATPK